MNALRRAFRIHRGEERIVGLVVGLMFVSVAGLTMGESGISALFFDRIGADRLPLMYLGQGAIGLIGMLVLTGALGRFDRRRAYVMMPLLLAGLVVVQRAIVATGVNWVYPSLWLTTTLGYLVQGVYLWGTAGIVTDTRRAKRLFPLFAAGNILGAVVGGLLTRPLAGALGAENLLVVWAIALAGSSLLAVSILGRGRGPRVRSRARPSQRLSELRQGFAFVRHSRLFVWMSVGSVLFSLLFFSLYLPFAQAASARYADPDTLAGFLGLFWAAVTGGAFLVSMVLTNRLIGWIGAASTLVVLPILYAGGFLTMLWISTFGAFVVIRFAVNVWLQGVSSPAWETLANVAPENRRDQARAFLNGGPAQAGTAIAGLVQIFGQDVLSRTELTVVGFAVAIATIGVARRIHRSYTTALVDAIRAGRPRVFDDALPNVPFEVRNDAQAVSLAMAVSNDPDPRMKRLAIELLGTADDDRAVDALRAALTAADPLVRARAVAALASQDRLPDPDVDRALRDDDAHVRLAAVRALGTEHLRDGSLLLDDDPSVVAATAARLIRNNDPGAVDPLKRLLSHENAAIRLAALRELDPEFLEDVNAFPEDLKALLSERLTDPSAAVRAAAIEKLGAAGSGEAVAAALEAIVSPEQVVRDAALAALDTAGLQGVESDLRRIVETRATLAVRDGANASSVPLEGDATEVLRDALLSRARANALIALSASSVLNEDRAAMRLALDSLGAQGSTERANALETIEVAVGARVARPLLELWEQSPAKDRRASGAEWLEVAANDDDPFIRACAMLVRDTRGAMEPMTRSKRSMTPMELVLVLRRTPLFSTLEPSELHRVAEIADEQSYADGDVIAVEGELGQEMHVVLEGTVRVVRGGDQTVATRAAGDVVGEMSIITQKPRVASLIAEGTVRTVCIDRRRFEAMVRERPDISLAVMRVLAERLATLTRGPVSQGDRA